MSLRSRVVAELVVLVLLTVAFLRLFPERPFAADVGLALFALALVASNARFTRRTIWARFPPATGKPDARRSFAIVGSVTAPALLVLLTIGATTAHRDGGAPAVASRLLTLGPLIAVALYFPWALLQQALFQFYLLGRLRVLFPPDRPAAAIVLTGVAYSLVHLPDPWVTGATAVGGVFWSWAYHRYRALSPLALSHAAVGSAFYYWVYGRDLAAAWFGWS
jgi:membrane protease YdiL (CAAX protease family)